MNVIVFVIYVLRRSSDLAVADEHRLTLIAWSIRECAALGSSSNKTIDLSPSGGTVIFSRNGSFSLNRDCRSKPVSCRVFLATILKSRRRACPPDKKAVFLSYSLSPAWEA